MRINLLHAHGSPTLFMYSKGCRCASCRGGAAIASRAYREAHHEWKTISDADYRAAHRDELQAYYAAYAAIHREHKNEGRRAWTAAHREENRTVNRAYYAAHREELLSYSAAYRATHHDEIVARNRNRKARLRHAPGLHTAADTRAQFDRQGGRCFWCGAKVAWNEKHVDHVVPLAKCGSNGPENLVIACPSCNLSKHAKHPMDFAGVMC